MSDHPIYLDDDGGGTCFVRFDAASNPDEVRAVIEREGHHWPEPPVEIDVVSMVPDGEGQRGESWYSIVPDGIEGAIRYWRCR